MKLSARRMFKLGAALAILLTSFAGVWAWGYSLGVADAKKATEVACHGDPEDCYLGSQPDHRHFEIMPAPYIVPVDKGEPPRWSI